MSSDASKTADVLAKINAMQKRAVATGKHGYSSVLAEAAREIKQLRGALLICADTGNTCSSPCPNCVTQWSEENHG